jgi:hypothetical protein
MARPTPTPRRSFLRSGLTGVLATGLAPRFVPARLLGAAAPSGKVTLGCIGVGSHGLGVNLNQFLQEDDCRIVAVCDVFANRRQRAREAVDRHHGGPGCAEFRDFRAAEEGVGVEGHFRIQRHQITRAGDDQRPYQVAERLGEFSLLLRPKRERGNKPAGQECGEEREPMA